VALGAGDCERIGSGLVAQPVNTASALAYLAVGAWLAGRGRPRVGLVVAAAGVGSVDYHGLGSPGAHLLHDASLYAVVGLVAWREVARRARRERPVNRAAYRAALAVTAAGLACWLAGRTGSPLCDPDSPLQGHAAWHLLSAAALALWAEAALGPPAQARS
jgi:hypothetical protein